MGPDPVTQQLAMASGDVLQARGGPGMGRQAESEDEAED
jgi:hypothetical protein